MTSLEELEVRQLQELTEYYRGREQRTEALKKEQSELLHGVSCTNLKVYNSLENVLQEQRQTREDEEQNELDLLNHFHSYEREKLSQMQSIREQLAKGLRFREGDSSNSR